MPLFGEASVARIDWEKQLGRRLKLQALHAFCAVAERGSLSQAARYFGCSQPAISALIAELEDAVGVRLLDRSPRGVEPNVYGHALLRRWAIALDELKQGINDIQSLTGSTAVEVRIGCTEGVGSAILAPVIEAFSASHSAVCLRIDYAETILAGLSKLRDRNVDVCLGRWRTLPVADGDLEVETLFEDETVVAASKRSPWAHRSKVDLAELADQSWILTPPESWSYAIIAESFRRIGLAMPKPFLMTYSVPLRVDLVADSQRIAVFPASVLRFNRDNLGLSALPVELPPQTWPIAIVSLKNRVLNPAAQLFCEQLRVFARTVAPRLDEENATLRSPGFEEIDSGWESALYPPFAQRYPFAAGWLARDAATPPVRRLRSRPEGGIARARGDDASFSQFAIRPPTASP
jgi:DNA-binding transcriptional LysR family regulator